MYFVYNHVYFIATGDCLPFCSIMSILRENENKKVNMLKLQIALRLGYQ